MNDESAARALNDAISRYAPNERDGCCESHTMESLAKRLSAPVGAVTKFIEQGLLTPRNPLVRGKDDRFQVYLSSELNALRRDICAAIATETIQRSESGDAAVITMAASHALRKNKEEADKAHVTEFSNASAGGAFMLSSRYDEGDTPSTLARVGKAAAVVGAVGAAGAGAAYLRGRLALSGSKSAAIGAVNTARFGLRRFRDDAQNAGELLKTGAASAKTGILAALEKFKAQRAARSA